MDLTAEMIAGIVAFLASLALLVRAFAFWVQANAKSRETAAEIQRVRVDIERRVQQRADDVEDRLLNRLERETELSSQKIAELDKLYRDTRHELDDTRRELDAAKIKIQNLMEDREQDKMRISTLTTERDELQKVISQMGREIGDLKERIALLEGALDGLRPAQARGDSAAVADIYAEVDGEVDKGELNE